MFAKISLCTVLTVFCLSAAALPPARAADDGDILIADFEGSDYGAWAVEGDAFGKGPVKGILPNQHPVSGFEGKGLVNSYLGGDGSKGTLTSPEFRIERKYINFLVGGGAHPGETCVELLVDAKAARTATGRDDEALDWESWDAGDLKGRAARIRIADRHTGGWGHISTDQVHQSDRKRAEPIVADVPYGETWRPQFHFSPRSNWTNDPNGMVFYKGEYHLFFQHNPSGINWGNMTWGHAVSPDMVHWSQLGHALLPDAMGTMFSGSAVVDWENTAGFQKGDEKTLVAIYTAAGDTSPESKGQPFTQCIAYSTDKGRTWTKYAKNPVLPHIVGGNRDPKVVWHAPTRKWVMALYKDGPTFAFFSSPDLKAWTHLQDLDVPGCGECPDFFEMPLDGDRTRMKWVWTAANGNYLVGTFDGKRFTGETGPHRADTGKNYYAVQTFSDIPDSDGRRIQIAWMNGGKYPGMPFNQQMSFPCELTLRSFPEGIRLCRMPVKEIEALRGASRRWTDLTLAAGADPLAGVEGDLFDIEAEIEPGAAAEIRFDLRGEAVRWTAADRKVRCLGAEWDLAPEGGRIRLRILLDRSSIEVFGSGGRLSMTSCFLPRPSVRKLGLTVQGGAAKAVALTVWPLRSSWK